jgi:hypothetical protein
MVSNNAGKTGRTGHLSFMTKISPYVSVYRPPEGSVAPASGDPQLILLMAWMNANTAHIAKYVRGYEDMFPSAQILLVRSTMGHVLFHNQVYVSWHHAQWPG